jgi:hypothetical protein
MSLRESLDAGATAYGRSELMKAGVTPLALTANRPEGHRITWNFSEVILNRLCLNFHARLQF